MRSPLAIATQGLINSPLSVAAVRGRLVILPGEVPDVPVALPGGSSRGVPIPSFLRETSPDLAMRRVMIEDEEILEIITTIARALDANS